MNALYPILVDQDGTTLIGVPPRGATVRKPAVFRACLTERERVERNMEILRQSFLTGKTPEELRRRDRRERLMQTVALTIGVPVALFTLAVLLSWALRGHP